MPKQILVPRRVNVEENFELERATGVRHEYVDGHAYPMTEEPHPGRPDNHNRIVVNVVALLASNLSDDFDVFAQSVPVDTHGWTTEVGVTYPDVVVAKVGAKTTPFGLAEPRLIAEVVDPKSERSDRLEYSRLKKSESLSTYIVLAQSSCELSVRRRENGWKEEILGRKDILQLAALKLKLPVQAFYRRVQFETLPLLGKH